MGYSKKTTHAVEGLAKLISQFQGQPVLEAVLRIYLDKIQELEDAFSDLLSETTIDNSVGVHLENIGAIVGEPKNGRSDELYRLAIKARIRLNKSAGTIEDIIAIAIAVANADVSIEMTEYFPAAFIARIVEPIDPAVTDVYRIADFINSARGGGIATHLEFAVEGAFQLDGPAGSGYDEGKYGGGIADGYVLPSPQIRVTEGDVIRVTEDDQNRVTE
jgi:hypothetical protein